MVDDLPVVPLRVLYAEDDPFDADLTRAHLAAAHILVDVVHTGEECLAKLQDEHYDVLLLDHHLPDMDGLDVLRHLSAGRIFLPVVVTTSVGDETTAVRVLQRGACDYVPKDGNYLDRLPAVLTSAVTEFRGRRESLHLAGRPARRVLYAEREASDIDLTRTRLAESAPDVRLEIVSSGADVLKRLGESEFDLVLTDLRLPEMNALDLLKEAKARGLDVPFIVVTGGGDETAAVAALKLGALDYIVKRDDYLTRLPYAIEPAIARAALVRINRQLQRELAERRRLQETTAEALALLDTLQNHAPIGIAFMDREYRFRRVNDELATITGLPAAEHIGRRLDEIVPDISRHVERLYLQALKGEAALNVEVGGTTAARPGEERHFVASFYPVRSSEQEVLGVGLTVAEVTARRRAEKALREHANALADVARQKDEFLAMLGHELRNPLAPICTALELLRRKGAQDDISAHAHDVIARQATHMARLLDDLLDVARMTTGRINLTMENVDMCRVVAEAIEGAGPLIAARQHRFRTSLPPHPVIVRGDAMRLVQVVVNLLTNAAKYTDEGGTIGFDVTTEEGWVVLRVTDTGVGISARLLPKIFDLFTQDERTLDRAQGGLGLGLTIVRRITELHGGRIDAQSEGKGRGSQFTIRLPLLVGDNLTVTPAMPDRVRPSEPLRCLVVEDNVDAAQMLELGLRLEGHDVHLAFDGLDAVGAAAAFRPQVVVMDIGLPRMNGYEAAQAIRQLPGLEDVQMIAVTGYGQSADFERSRSAGFDSHLVKPIELDMLLRTLAAGRHTPPPG